jgi:hypothetical protein
VLTLKELFKKCNEDPQFESEKISKRPLRGVQAEIIKRVEAHVAKHQGGVMTVQAARQTGKNETAAIIQRRHLWRNQNSPYLSSWIRTAPTHEPQIVNSKKRLENIMRISNKNVIGHPMFLSKKIQKSEGYIWKLGNATVEFMSSGPHSNVVGATASECLDMDEAHQISKDKFDEDFAPFTASTNAATVLWGVAADGMDTIESYRQLNIESGKPELNLYYPCELWAEVLPAYKGHLEDRIRALGWDHPIMKTQYRLIPVSHEGTFINSSQARVLFDSDHNRHLSPESDCVYEMMVDVAAGNEDFNPTSKFMNEAEIDAGGNTPTDSTVIWIYQVTDKKCVNNLFPVLKLVNIYWWTGVPLPKQEVELTNLIEFWRVQKVTIDGVGVGRQMAEAIEQKFGSYIVNKYIANATSVSDDCFDLLARLNYGAVKMFRNDGSPEWAQFEKQVGWTKYASNKGKMNLAKSKSDQHIDMVKALTYLHQNHPDSTIHQILTVESEY